MKVMEMINSLRLSFQFLKMIPIERKMMGILHMQMTVKCKLMELCNRSKFLQGE